MAKFADLGGTSTWKSWMQALAVLALGAVIILGLFFGWIIWACLVYYSTWCWRLPLVTYAIWIYVDTSAAETGSRRSHWLRSWSWWRFTAEYFPVKLVKTAELSPKKNYILATFPHGLVCMGAIGGFGSDHCGFELTYPGLRSHLAILRAPFYIPFLRELVLATGLLPASASCIRRTLSNPAKGEAVCVVVGGIPEAMFTKPGVYKVYLKKRKGFVRIALETGASLVPVINFGEPELYDQVQTEGTWIRTAQDFFKKVTGIPPILFVGRGEFLFSIMPRRHPIHVVVGEPIDVKQCSAPSDEEINKLHDRFIESLQKLFDTEKSKFLEDPECELTIT